MSEIKAIVRSYMAQGLKRDKALQIAGMSKDQFYHRPTGKKGGIKKSNDTEQLKKGVWEKVPNKMVKAEIKEVKENPLKGYGYRKMTYELQQNGYRINHKKVYRLMNERSQFVGSEKRAGKEGLRKVSDSHS